MTPIDDDNLTTLNDDIISEDAMRAIMMEAGPSGEFIGMMTASGTTEYIENDQVWLNDLIAVDKQLKACFVETRYLDVSMLAQPVAYNSDSYSLRGDPLLDTLIEAFVVLETIFNLTSIGQIYRPSPYAESFLRAFSGCVFLHTCVETDTPFMSWTDAESTVSDLNSRLLSWRAYMSTPNFKYQCSKGYRNSRENRNSMKNWVSALFQSHAYLQVIRVDVGYRKDIATSVPYALANDHRAKLCKAFHYHPIFENMIGYSWKLEWGQSRGFHYHLLFFFDASKVQKDVIRAQWVGELWSQKITNGSGTYYNCNIDAEKNYFYNALGKMSYYDADKRAGLKYLIHYLTKVDEYASLVVPGKTFFHSRTPPLPDGVRRGRPRKYDEVFLM
ncbi:inovirus-type Gp2 protein [Halomonas coralii]|uniref:YagK/YfjJ domain-containing protein n=1 Tax=Modicisalibacter sp. R2A 31.J TaxID=2831898 RepID=UPI001CCDAB19|nr:inovirus-type Gp2 protein [Modicisalibacter sp. R2A 31.J]MBZ9557332.1 inovirus-type Gp2 protein [Modicisalibacter sp. R2A 31.J]